MPPSDSKDATTTTQQVDTLKKDISKRAEDLIYKKFPLNIAKLRELLKSDLWQISDYSQIVSSLPPSESLLISSSSQTQTPESNGHQQVNGVDTSIDDQGDTSENAPASKRQRMSDEFCEKVKTKTKANISHNPHVSKVSEQLKPILREFIDNCSVIKVWISLLVPKMEDGNNFGVSIQAEVVKEVTYYEDDAAKYYEDVIEYFTNRAKLCSKVIKYPQIEDYRTAVKECDERQFVYLTRFVTAQLLHSHALLHDLISKNYEKIQRPRGESSSSMNMY